MTTSMSISKLMRRSVLPAVELSLWLKSQASNVFAGAEAASPADARSL